MLRLTLTLVPYGIESRARKIGEVEIVNVSGDAEVADYEVRVTHDQTDVPAKWGSFVLHSHRRSLGAWELARRALEPAAKETVTQTLREWAEHLLSRIRGELAMRRGGMQAGSPRWPPSLALEVERELAEALEGGK